MKTILEVSLQEASKAKDAPGITYAEIDLDYLDKIRKQIPSLENRRSDLYEVSEKK